MKTVHSRRQAIAFALVLGFAPVLASPARAATEFSGSIPLELARVFLGMVPNETGTAVYADVADNFPAVAFPDEYTVLGSVVRPFTQTVYLRADIAAVPDPGMARSEFAELYAAAGWLSMDTLFNRNIYRGGFIGNESLEIPSQLCHDDFGILSINAAAGDYLLVTLTRNDRQMNSGQSCSEMLASQQQFADRRALSGGRALQQYMPRLELPVEADAGSAGRGSSSSNDEMEATAALELQWDMADIYEHFAPQIEAQGWEPDGNWETGFTAGGSWTRSPAADVDLLGMLMIVQKETGSYQLKFRLLAR